VNGVRIRVFLCWPATLTFLQGRGGAKKNETSSKELLGKAAAKVMTESYLDNNLKFYYPVPYSMSCTILDKKS
jgi:hypothetical protein